MAIKLTNNAFGRIPAALSSIDTEFTVSTGSGVLFPILGTGDYCYITVSDVNSNFEIMKLTARVDDAFTVVRGQQNTLAIPFPPNSYVELRVTAQDIIDAATDAAADAIANIGGIITYDPADPTDWNNDQDPGNVDDALDQLANRITTIETTTIGLVDGDKGDITVTNNGTTWTIDQDTITLAKLQNIASPRVLGRVSNGSGDIEQLTLTQTLDIAGTPAQGNLLMRSATTWEVLPEGESGQMLAIIDPLFGGTGHPQWVTGAPTIESICVACSDETTPLTTGLKRTFRLPYNFRIDSVFASLTSAQASGSILTVDIKTNTSPEPGFTSIFTTLLTVDNQETSSVSAATPYVFAATPMDKEGQTQVQIHVTQVDAATAAAGLKVYFIGQRLLAL